MSRAEGVPTGFAERLTRLETGLRVLPDKADETPLGVLQCLWALAEGERLSPAQVERREPAALNPEKLAHLDALLERRLAGEPLAHITERQDFMGLVLRASPDALIPRRETELLGREAVRILEAAGIPDPLVVDVCTGSGNVALGIAVLVPGARVLGSDLSDVAVELARDNARFVGRPDVAFFCGDLLDPFSGPEFEGRIDLITCNPPYISSAKLETMPGEIRDHEPRLAFDGGAFGVSFLRRLVADVPPRLADGGWLVLEVGAGQGASVARLLSRSGHFLDPVPVTDDAGVIRVLCAQRRPRSTA